MTRKSPIFALTSANLDRVTGGCKLVTSQPVKPSLGSAIDQLGLADVLRPQRGLDGFEDRVKSLASDLLGEIDLGTATGSVTEAVSDMTSTLPPLWCGPTNGLPLPEQIDGSTHIDESDDMDDMDACDDDMDACDDDMDACDDMNACDDMDAELIVSTAPDADDMLGDEPVETAPTETAPEATDAGSPWNFFVDGPPPAASPFRGDAAETEKAPPPALDPASVFVMGPPPSIAPFGGAGRLDASPASSNLQIRDHRRG